ncbi:group II intron reverse transcriptase/maturase [Bacillus benzoevorans]|uniref:Group II intron reverse transcriptase/maturase n=1 Tax=Bacillus benzoevorans TaxID=1456 RepID=A0A7X0HW59_9BACI|nr:group II intron reverse transcriptase/maturase [Bacillus benzoevorans]MBB6447997.1 group II intron reverse transcriptase/maturase [Bacillus benzoevorans]
MQTTLRTWDYYSLTNVFTDLHEKAKEGTVFKNLYDLIVSRENILLAYRTIKSNTGSKTAGTDKRTIDDIKAMTEFEIVTLIKTKLENYNPKKVRRVLIPKPNGKERPLGIPCIIDRIIQQCFKQILEPIAEAKFYKHSYGFRPLRSTHHAMARVQSLINLSGLHYVVDIDIKGFFDNINHTILMKQLWNMGIQDRKVLRLIGKMLKAEIDGEGIPKKGTPQGGIISPLLSNIVLNDLDQWVAGQWENFETVRKYNQNQAKYSALKKTNLKEGYIVRYADDFKILCRDSDTAYKWYHSVRLYLKERLKLDISLEKSKVVNLKKKQSEFLGFTIKSVPKKNKWVANTGVNAKKRLQLKARYKELIKQIQKSPTSKNTLAFNSFIMGIHNYFKKATHVSIEFSQLAYELMHFTKNRLKGISKYGYPGNAPPTFKKFYTTKRKTYCINGIYLYPLSNVRTSNNMNFSQTITPFTCEGRQIIYNKIKGDVQSELTVLMKSSISDRSVEYMDNRLSRYSMKMGKCEVTGNFLYAHEVHCHHKIPLSFGGTDKFNNLCILNKDIHKLVHAIKNETITTLKNLLRLSQIEIEKVNKLRKMSNLELID